MKDRTTFKFLFVLCPLFAVVIGAFGTAAVVYVLETVGAFHLSDGAREIWRWTFLASFLCGLVVAYFGSAVIFLNGSEKRE